MPKKLNKKDLNDKILFENNFDDDNSNNNSDENLDKLPSEDEITNDQVSQKLDKKVQTDFLDKVIKYVKTDDLIRKETLEFREKINTLKEEKIALESHILRYLEEVDQEVVNIGASSKLTKAESIRKSTISQDIIKISIFEQLKKEGLVKDDKKCMELAEMTYNLMDSKREKKTKTYLKRTFKKKKK